MARKDLDNDFSFQELEEHLELLESKGFSFITYADFISGAINGTKNILITIDDGYKSAYDAYFTVLKPRGIAPLFALYPGVISNKKICITWDEARQLAKEPGVAIAAHGYYHLYVTKKLHDEDYKGFMNEIYRTKKVLEEKLQITIDSYAYPFGLYSPITIEHLQKAGYLYAFTIKSGRVSIPVKPASYEIRRWILYRKSAMAQLKEIIRDSEL